MPLPSAMGVKGAWVIENRIYLSREPGVKAHDGSTLSLVQHTPDGKPCVGINATRLASQLGLTVEQLFIANQYGRLRNTRCDRYPV